MFIIKINMGWMIFNKGYCGQLIFVLVTHEKKRSKMSQGFLHHVSSCSGFWVPLFLLGPFVPLLQPHAYFPLHAAVCECCTCSSPLVSSQMRLHLSCIWKKEININCNSLLLSQNWPPLVKWSLCKLLNFFICG